MSVASKIVEWVARRSNEDATKQPPKVRDGVTRISDPEEIPEPYADATCKDVPGERYLGTLTGVVYIRVKPWEIDGG